MQLLKLFKWLGIVLFFSLTYVNIQMRIIDLAYKEESFKRHIRNIAEDNSNLTYKILTLKSSSNLGVKVLGDNPGLRFGGHKSIMKLSTPEMIGEDGYPIRKSQAENRSSPLISLLSLSARETREKY